MSTTCRRMWVAASQASLPRVLSSSPLPPAAQTKMPNPRRKKAARAPAHAITSSISTDAPRAWLSDDRRPDMLKNPTQWEESWSKDLAFLWSGPQSKFGNPNVTIASHKSSGEAKVCIMEACMLNLQAVLAQVARTQMELGRDVALRSVTHDYERDWRELTDTGRRDVILKGICNAMHGGTLIPARIYCPDSTVDFLASRNGEQYLDYLHALLPENIQHPATEPKTIPHPTVDRYLTIGPPYLDRPGYKVMAHVHQMLRSQCLTMMILDIFGVFRGKPFVERRMLKLPSGQTQVIKALQGVIEGATVERVKHTLNLFREAKKTWDAGCSRCGRACATDHCLLSESTADFKLQACTKCRAVGRTVLYSSKDCQIADWKYGIPVPHKAICGKLISEDLLVDPGSVRRDSPFPSTREEFRALPIEEQCELALFPPPAPGFKRTLALQLQIEQLRQHRAAHYIIFTGEEGAESFCLTWTENQEDLCNLMTDRCFAFATGWTEAVQRLYARVCYYAGMHHIPHAVVKRQMEKEFPGIPLDGVSLDWISYKDGEMEEPDVRMLESMQKPLRDYQG